MAQDSIDFADYRWPELKGFAERGAVVLLPIGQVEEHGPHLPVGCDCRIAVETARAVADLPVHQLLHFDVAVGVRLLADLGAGLKIEILHLLGVLLLPLLLLRGLLALGHERFSRGSPAST